MKTNWRGRSSVTRLAVIGGGWARARRGCRSRLAGRLGHAVRDGAHARRAGARSLEGIEPTLDNGQHILIGAYTDTLALMRRVGGDPDLDLLRMPLRLRYPDRETLRLPPGPPTLAFLRGVMGCAAWSLRDRLRFLMTSSLWTMRGFRCAPALTVAQLCAGLPRTVRDDLIDPLCVAALNTPSSQASAQVFLRVLKDALFSGPRSADLLLPRRGLGALLPTPARAWLLSRGAEIRTQRVQQLDAEGRRWVVDGDAFDAVIVACTSVEGVTAHPRSGTALERGRRCVRVPAHRHHLPGEHGVGAAGADGRAARIGDRARPVRLRSGPAWASIRDCSAWSSAAPRHGSPKVWMPPAPRR